MQQMADKHCFQRVVCDLAHHAIAGAVSPFGVILCGKVQHGTQQLYKSVCVSRHKGNLSKLWSDKPVYHEQCL